LLDASLDAGTLLKIREIVAGEPTVAEVESVTGRNAGRFRFIEIEVTLRSSGLEKAEAATQHIERQIRQSILNVERVLIHAEPERRTHLRYAAPLADMDGTLSEHFGEAPYFALITVRRADGTLEKKQIVANPYRREERAKGIRVSEWLVNQKADLVLLKRSLSGKGPAYVFGDAAVEMWETEAPTLSAALSEIASGR
jgi:predicted Fe-Mo cluster-binding NifX family protein